MGVGIAPSALESARQAGASLPHVPVNGETPPQTTERPIRLLDAAIQGAALGAAVFVAVFVLNLLSLSAWGGAAPLIQLLNWLGGAAAMIAFGVAAYKRGLRGWRLWLAIGLIYYLPFTLPWLAPVEGGAGAWTLLIGFAQSMGMIVLAAVAGAIVGSQGARAWWRAILSGRGSGGA